MNLRQIFDINNANMSVSGFFAAYGSFGSVDGAQSDIEKITATEKGYIAQFKLDRDFYKNATVRILHDVQDITVLQYSDTDLKKIKIQVFTNVVNQSYITVYPVLRKGVQYVCNDEMISADELMKNGIKVDLSDINCTTIDIKSSFMAEKNLKEINYVRNI